MQNYIEQDYRVVYGVEKNTFDEMVKIVEKEYFLIHKKGDAKMG